VITESAPLFVGALADGGPLVGLDLGTKTIGLAYCDAGWRFASPGRTIARGKFSRDLEALRTAAAERSSAGWVLGLPRNMDGTEGPRAQATRAFARNLGAALSLPILLWDERWSSVSVDRAMIEQDWSRKRRERRIDAHAAAVILQGAIDAMTH
jgi:putative Holliday junction resolvase